MRRVLALGFCEAPQWLGKALARMMRPCRCWVRWGRLLLSSILIILVDVTPVVAVVGVGLGLDPFLRL
jgi:hypothetical protein